MVSGMLPKSYTCRMILRPSHENILRATEELRKGGVVAVPAETVYGLAARIDQPAAIDEIFRRKGRPRDNPLIVHVANVEQAYQLTNAAGSEVVDAIAERFWPGPLTVVVPVSDGVSTYVTAGLTTVAIRMPHHPVFLDLIRTVGCPLAAPSANISGKPSPTSAEHVETDFHGEVLVLDGGRCEIGLESTVVHVVDGAVHILRPGAISAEQLHDIGLGRVERVNSIRGSDVARSPGMRYRHYAPMAQVVLCKTVEEVKAACVHGATDVIVLVPEHALNCFTGLQTRVLLPQSFYEELRRADDLQTRLIVVLCDQSVIAQDALYNRIQRASGMDEQGH